MGENRYGELGQGDQKNRSEFCKISQEHFNNEAITMLSVGSGHSMVVTENSVVYGWGLAQYNQCGFPCGGGVTTPVKSNFWMHKSKELTFNELFTAFGECEEKTMESFSEVGEGKDAPELVAICAGHRHTI